MGKTSERDWKKEFQALIEEFDDLWKKYNVANYYSPAIYTCKNCGGYYADGYLCFCGFDNGVVIE